MTTRARIAGGDAGSPAWALADIDGQLYKREVDAGHETWAPVAAVAEADGLSFLCPACLDAHGDDDVGTHSVMCWFVGRVPDDVSPKPGRWTPAGSTIADITFIPSAGRSVSILLTGDGCKWHGHIRNGRAVLR